MPEFNTRSNVSRRTFVALASAASLAPQLFLRESEARTNFRSDRRRIRSKFAIIDDYAGDHFSPGDRWFYSRVGTDRGTMPTDFPIGGGDAEVRVDVGWRGVWTSLVHRNKDPGLLNPIQLLGPFVLSPYQISLAGFRLNFRGAQRGTTIALELKDSDRQPVLTHERRLKGGPESLEFLVSLREEVRLKEMNWIVRGAGSANMKDMHMLLSGPEYAVPEAVFLFSYGHLSQCYDQDEGILRDRARWPASEFSAVQASGMFALITAVAADYGYVNRGVAKDIVQAVADTVLNLIPTHNGMLPHFVEKRSGKWQNISAKKFAGVRFQAGEWSTVDTAITYLSLLLAQQGLELSTREVERRLQNINWGSLSVIKEGKRCIGHGFSGEAGRAKLASCWDTFGSEALIVAIACAIGTGEVSDLVTSGPPTWDGSGFNDELAALLVPTIGRDAWGNNWAEHRKSARQKQLELTPRQSVLRLFGHSASEVPVPWKVSARRRYAAWGVGGHNGQKDDGTEVAGFPIYAPHYAAMIMNEEMAAETMFCSLIENGYFTPLNNVEAISVDTNNVVHWNSLKGSWNLCLQALGAARAIRKHEYVPYQWAKSNSVLWQGFRKVFP